MNEVSHPSGYERSDADPRLIAGLALGVALFLAAAPLLLGMIYPASDQPRGGPNKLSQPLAPRLEVDPKANLTRFRAVETARLNSYGWTDRAQHIAHIPIARAIALLADRGIPGWRSPAAPVATPPAGGPSPH